MFCESLCRVIFKLAHHTLIVSMTFISFHPALKFTWEISETSVTFLDINISVQDNKLATSVHYKPTDSHSYSLYSSSHPSHVKYSIPYSPNFSDSVGSAAKIQTLTPNAMKCLISFPNVAILTASCLKHSIVSKTSMENPL